ncbi:hypothetical protein PPERSA_00603 [Pseudocohnilembus persalinus]|uniref:Uncharacterized protein n=1 Tax=Pseudocohnilembus persalinus TaxID=266149 RepID=A0A0V0QST1_PSEPJ|nr:hypothetical protein PPERSA_00603 [Pseudocohnilembus persalinus]|eukprot:KRX05302.1 hypothetical protein PPERSA_00603 [Pseudocohnilembus persalinus]
MESIKSPENIQSFIQKLDEAENKEQFFEFIQNYETEFFKQYETNVQSQLPPELQKKEPQPQTPQNVQFLSQDIPLNREHLQGSQKFQKWGNRQSSKEQRDYSQHIYKNYQDQQLNPQQCVNPNQNYLDVEANSKYFYQDNDTQQFREFNRPQQDFANTQSNFLQKKQPQSFQQPGVKDIYPRQLLGNNKPEMTRPPYMGEEKMDMKLRENIEKLGGLQDCLQIMEPSLKQYEMHSMGSQPQYQQKQDFFGTNMVVNDKNTDPSGLIQGRNLTNQMVQSQFTPFQNSNNVNNQNGLERKNSSGNLQQQQQQQYQQNQYDPFSQNPYTRLQQQNISVQDPFNNSRKLNQGQDFNSSLNLPPRPNQNYRGNGLDYIEISNNNSGPKFLTSQHNLNSGKKNNSINNISQNQGSGNPFSQFEAQRNQEQQRYQFQNRAQQQYGSFGGQQGFGQFSNQQQY